MLFREAGAVVLNKTDLMAYTDFNYQSFLADLNQVNPNIPLFELSCRTGQGLDKFLEWVKTSIIEKIY